MKTPSNSIVLILLVIFGLTACNQPGKTQQQPASATTQVQPGADVREKVARDIVDNNVKKDYAAVRKDFAKTMLDALSEEKIKTVWEAHIAQVGDFQKVLTTKEEQSGGYTIIKKRLQFARQNSTIQVTFNDENQVIGLFIRP
jgi:hypothetical protein